MKLAVTSVDYNPPELNDQIPFTAELLRMLPGPDRPDYWLAKADTPLRWIDDNHQRRIEYLVVCARWQGTQIEPKMSNLPIGIAYVTDSAQITEPSLSFDKCKYVAIGIASKVAGAELPAELDHIISGNIAPGFGMGR
jgi:hypothetical protein